jgi:hypothetical protein
LTLRRATVKKIYRTVGFGAKSNNCINNNLSNYHIRYNVCKTGMKYRLFHLVLLECLNRQLHATLHPIKCAKMLFNYVTFFACGLIVVYCKNLPDNNTAIISTYAKVAHWGAVSSTTTEKTQSEARSHNGQSLWTHRYLLKSDR